MDAVALTLAIFACWGVVGYALTSLLLPRRHAIPNLLLAPVVGMGALELAAHIGLRCGSPVGPVAWPIVGGALLIASASLAIRRPPLPLRRLWPFALILLIAFTLSGWPMFRWGGDWVANANDDMANYCLAATGFREHGFLSMPVEEYLAGRDLTHGAWFLYGDIGSRHGCEMSLAMTSAITSLPAPTIFMPVILASHLVLVSATGFLTCRLKSGRTAAIASCGLMAVSPLSSYGITQQLIAQVGGVALLAASMGLFCRPARRLTAAGWACRGALAGIIAAALVLHYTEIVPFLVLGFGLYTAVGLVRGRRDVKQLAIVGLAAFLVPALLGTYLIDNFSYLMHQIGQGSSPILAIIFPQYLNNEGLARLWGFASLNEQVVVRPQSPVPIHRVVVAGGLLLVLALTASIALAWRRRPVAIMLFGMLGTALYLFKGPNPFGLFKLAMFIQPFLLGTIALAWVRFDLDRWKRAGLLTAAFLIYLQAGTQFTYVSTSIAKDTLTAEATRTRLLSGVRDALRAREAKRFVVDVGDPVVAKWLASSAPDVALCMPVGELCLVAGETEPGVPISTQSGGLEAKDALTRIVTRTHGPGDIALLDPVDRNAVSQLRSYAPDWLDRPEPGDYLLDLPEQFTLFNRVHRSPNNSDSCTGRPLREVSNYLVWRRSSRSRSSALNRDPAATGMYALQPDPLFPRQTMAAAGRFLTFQVLNPSSTVRVMVAGTASFIPDQPDLPPAAVVGDRRVLLPLTGLGAGRVTSEPIALQNIGTAKFLVLDLGRTGTSAEPAAWQDLRVISLYLRDVSVLSEDEYAALAPPQCVKAFPADLANKHLEFSGCCEDGWMGRRAWFRITRPAAARNLVVRGMLPLLGGDAKYQTELVVRWNGDEVGRRTIKVGEFEVQLPVPPDSGPGTVALEFADARRLPAPSVRVASALLKFVGFER